MDPDFIAGLLFTLILFGMLGGFVLLFPITRRLGPLLEQRLKARPGNDRAADEIRQLQAAVHSLREEVAQLSERQSFTESLVAERPPLLLSGEEAERRSNLR